MRINAFKVALVVIDGGVCVVVYLGFVGAMPTLRALLHPQSPGLAGARLADRLPGRTTRQSHPGDSAGLLIGNATQLRADTNPLGVGKLTSHVGSDLRKCGKHHDTARNSPAPSKYRNSDPPVRSFMTFRAPRVLCELESLSVGWWAGRLLRLWLSARTVPR